MSWLQRNWYKPATHPLLWLLLPLTVVFYLLSTLRRSLYKAGIKKQHKMPVPVVVVGNISVGGNGKTPLVILLAEWLQQAGYRPGVLSRGYGGKAAYPMTVTTHSDAANVGDEPLLMKGHLSCPLVIDPKRPRGARYLIEKHQCDLILCDDGMQHYALARDIEIAVVDGSRRHGNCKLLPMGPLREAVSRLDNVDFVVSNGGAARQGEHSMQLQPGDLVNLQSPTKRLALDALKQPVVAAAAIGNPQRFFALLRIAGVQLKQQLVFADHHQFEAADLPRETLLMTEKDAVKCVKFAHQDWWYLPVTATLGEDFRQQLLTALSDLQH